MSHRYLILGLLSERPMSGYDIRKLVKGSLSAVINASYGTLYPTLHQLLDEKLVLMEEVPQRGRPAKKLYRLTARGERELNDWLRQPAAADQVRREFLLKFYLARQLPEPDLQELIEQRRAETEANLKALGKLQSNAHTEGQRWVVDYALAIAKAEMQWLADVSHSLKR